MANPKNLKNKIIVLLFIISILVFLFTLYTNSLLVLEKKEIPVFLKVGEVAAFNLSATELSFGTITPGSNARRNITLKNEYDFPVKFEFRAKGDAKKFFLFEKRIYLAPYEKKNIEINTIIPSGENYGDYSGKIIVSIRKTI